MVSVATMHESIQTLKVQINSHKDFTMQDRMSERWTVTTNKT
jgi:hypothetical protein